MVNFLRDVLSPDDQCVCVFTKQEGFQKNLVLFDEDGLSKSGIWKLDRTKMEAVNRVVVYYRREGINHILVGDYKGFSPTIFRNRYCIRFRIRTIEQTLNDWDGFCGAGSNPILYFP